MPSSNFIYVSYSSSLAKKQTQTVREILLLPQYQELFSTRISPTSSAKDNFETIQGGSVYAVGSQGTITGRGAGIQGCDDFGGAIIIDDIHKPIEVLSDTMRQATLDWHLNTLQSRVNSPKTPIISIGQRLHEDDHTANLLKGYDGRHWKHLSLPALDTADNALLPTMHSKEQLMIMKDKMPYDFASQYQQDPQPAGGGIFKPDWFVKLDYYPEMVATFLTADTSETDKNYNDATVFSFWGLYKIQDVGIDTEQYGLHWIDCVEDWIEPKDLKDRFLGFYRDCLKFPVKPHLCAIEKKSTGVTLTSVLQELRGINIFPIERSRASGSKGARFNESQYYVASKLISLPTDAKHTHKCIEHMRKITLNDSHRYDDIADTCADAIRLAFIDKVIMTTAPGQNKQEQVVDMMAQHFKRQQMIGQQRWQK